MIRLVIRLKNGNEVSGTYAWPDALSMLDFASRQPDFVGFDLTEAI